MISISLLLRGLVEFDEIWNFAGAIGYDYCVSARGTYYIEAIRWNGDRQ